LRIYEETGDWDKAYDTLKQIQRLRGKDDRGLLALYRVFAGRALDEKGEHHKARLKYKEALRIDEQCTAAYLFLGDSYVAEKRLDDAIVYWKKMMEAVPEQAYLCFERMEKTQFELGDFSSMIQIYDELIQKKPDDLSSLFAFVRIKEKMGQIDEAIALCHQALERDHTSQDARWCLVRCYHARGDTKQALRYALDLEKTYRQRRVFICRSCGYQSTEIRWRCPKCKNWRTFL
jgi:lipopolysaccharide biosynthesis regulator YciM